MENNNNYKIKKTLYNIGFVLFTILIIGLYFWYIFIEIPSYDMGMLIGMLSILYFGYACLEDNLMEKSKNSTIYNIAFVLFTIIIIPIYIWYGFIEAPSTDIGCYALGILGVFYVNFLLLGLWV